MRRSVIMLLNEAKQKLSGYLGLFSYRLMNLCVKAEPASLLSVELKSGDTSFGLESLADVGQTDEYHFVIIPKDRSLVSDIVKGIVKVHPEFKYEIKRMDQNTVDDDEEADVYLYISMPEVNEDRKDALKDSVNVLYDECKLKCDLTFDKYLEEISAKLISAPENEKKEGKEQLEKLHDQIQGMMDGYKEKKLKEIEDGYQLYLKEKEDEIESKQKMERAHNSNAGMSMRMFGEEEDDE